MIRRAAATTGLIITATFAAPDALAHEAGAPADGKPAIETPAQSLVRKLPLDALKAPAPRRFSSSDYYVNPRVAVVMDEIRVYGQVEPEDYVKRVAPMQRFRNQLERDRPATPKETAQSVLCVIGLCGIYGPDGIPLEVTAAERSEQRLSQSTTQLNSQFRGTLQ
jgi:hypothetical protein